MPGPFFFAWVSAAETTWSAAYAREDVSVYSFELTHAEGEFAELKLDVRNPRVGLLSEGRDQWAWFSWDSGEGVEPLFFGRLIGVPEDLHNDVVRFAFIARPEDYDAQKATAAEALKVTPFYDPIWIAEEARSDPDTVLEGRPALWHIDRVSHEVTASDIITGEDGLLVVGGGFFFDSLRVSYGQPPVSTITCEAEVHWDQGAAGSVDLRQTLVDAFAAAGTTDGGYISSYTGEGLQRDWPEQGDRIGAGWTVGLSECVRVDGIQVIGRMFTAEAEENTISFPLWVFDPVFYADYAVERQRTERLTFSVGADVQALLSAPREEAALDLKIATSEVDKPVDPGGALPIGDRRRKSYFLTDRGKRSLEHLIVRARAQLLSRARAVNVAFEAPFATVAQLSCRHSATVVDDRLPGGQATGKVVGYRLALDGDTGAAIGAVTLACTIGRGQSLAPSLPTPDYVADGYVETGWQATSGGAIEVAAGDIAYASYDNTPIDDDGVDLLGMNAAHAVLSCVVVGGETEQEAAVTLDDGDFRTVDRFADMSAAINALNEVFTEVALTLRPLKGGPFETEFAVAVTDLMIPRTIDLESV